MHGLVPSRQSAPFQPEEAGVLDVIQCAVTQDLDQGLVVSGDYKVVASDGEESAVFQGANNGQAEGPPVRWRVCARARGAQE